MNSKSSSSPLLSVNSATAPAESPDHRLTFRTRHRGDVVILSIRGQADAFTLSLWRQTVREAAGTAAKAGGALIIDAGRLDFLSLRTLGALVEDAGRFSRDGVRTCLVTTDLRIARLLAADPATAPLTVRSTVVSAHTALESPTRSAAPAVLPDDDAEVSGDVLPPRRRFHGRSSTVIPISARKAVAAGVRR
ncbi:STAS domain-containing protein [Nocardia shimofusensis]|uniref:STAS domain-containing protein n=1 Tax=Nocardia shimofusensis TaxID=228596 RepID=UPI00082964EB|nr:STAS domain-containing protein [Nocardia shimofusensis]